MVALPLWLNLGLLGLLVGAGFADARRINRRWRDLPLEQVLGKARHLYLAVGLILPLVAAHLVLYLRPDWFWHLPVWLELYYMAIVWGSIIGLFGFLFGFAVTLALRTGHRERFKLLCAAVLLVGAVQVAQWHYTRPVAARLADWVTADGIVMQSTGVSCAAASGANIARSLGLDQSERDMARRFGTTEMGTSAAQVVRGFAGLGVRCDKRLVADSDVTRVQVPAMLFIDHPSAGPESHAVALIRHGDSDQARVYDPLTGSPISPAALARSWHGRAVECSQP